MTTGTPTDAELLARLAGPWEHGGREALAGLYGRHEAALRGFLARFNGSANQEVDDWMQDTFLIAQAHAHRFHGSSARPWLLSIAARRVRDSRRAARRRSDREHVAAERAADGAVPSDVRDSVEELIGGLDERDRVVLELRHVQGLSHAAAAEVLGVSLRTAKIWSSHALERLRERWTGAEGHS